MRRALSSVLSSGLPVALALTVLCGCSTLPTGGEVRSRPDTGSGSGAQAPYFAPPGPVRGEGQEGVVRGYLLAMQANPPTTAVARSFLSERAAATWQPNQGTLVYDGSTVEALDPEDGMIRIRLSDAHRLDPRGRWDSESTGPRDSIDLRLVREDGEWRIDNPPKLLAVPASYFPSLFVPFHLYFYDRTGSVLVPERVYLPRGAQTATSLLRGLLAGPRSTDLAALSTALPALPSTLDRGVLVSDAGVAEVPMAQGVLRLSEEELGRVVAQLAWTLRQVPGITRLRLTVGGIGVPLPNDQTDVSVRTGAKYDPVTTPGRTPLGLIGRRVVRIDSDNAVPVGGPFGSPGFALRSVAGSAELGLLAGVAGNGRVLYVAPDSGAASADRVRVAVPSATDLLEPRFDRYGTLWAVDRTANGAVVHVVRGGVDRVVRVAGVSGRRITAFTLTRDGSRIVAAVAGDAPRLVVATLVRGPLGGVRSTIPGPTVVAGDSDLGPVVDLGQSGETTLAVLTQPAAGPGRIVHVELDGSPGDPSVRSPEVLPASVLGLAASADPERSVRVVTDDGRLLVQDDTGQWVASALGSIRAVAYPE